MFTSPGSVAFSFSVFDIHWYGIIMSLSILFGMIVVILIKNRFYKEITTDSIIDITLNLIIFGLVGARLYYVLLDFPYYFRHPFEIAAIRNGGISIQGAVIGGVLAILLYAKENKINFLKYADLFSFGLVFGQISGRWGNFFNSEAFGLPCNLPWKLYIPFQYRPVEYRSFEYFHPAFLYESLLSILIFLILYLILNKTKNLKAGTIFFSYIILYSLARIFTESIRIDSVLNIGVFHAAHIMSFIFIAAGLSGLYFIYGRKKIS